MDKPLSETHPSLVGKSPYPLMRKAINTKTLSVATQAMIDRCADTIELPYKELKVFDEEVIQLHTRDVEKLKKLYQAYEKDLDAVPPDRAEAFNSLMNDLKEIL